MEEIPQRQVRITGGFWGQKLAVNVGQAIEYQWEQLEKTGCIENFRLAAGRAVGIRVGFYFSDSDAYKWLDAAACILATQPDERLRERVDGFIDLIEAAMTSDGYLYTYNQLFFPEQRWTNLQTEHIFYCLGHLIEAAVSHNQATGSARLLALAKRSADLLVRDFWDASPAMTDGHEEIELALLRLSRATGDVRYQELASRLLARRGRTRGFGWVFMRQLLSTGWRLRAVTRRRWRYYQLHPDQIPTRLPARNASRLPRMIFPRLLASMLSGKFIQQHRPVEQQTEPVGHAVRFTYLQTAVAKLARAQASPASLNTMRQVWDHMVTRRMFVTGGLGALPLLEGFGRDDELDPQTAYAETCAALGSMFWNRELALLTGDPRYDALFEWQLYNAASGGMGLDGKSYLYNNPLECRGGITRAAWYDVPCCPSNLSRTWASLGGDLYSLQGKEIRVRQYISSRAEIPFETPVTIEHESGLPWQGNGQMVVRCEGPQRFTISLRIPAWAGEVALRLNGQAVDVQLSPQPVQAATACGFDPRCERLLRVERDWQDGDCLDYSFALPIRLLAQSPRIPGCGGKVAVSRGPLVYCLEDVDNPQGIFDLTLSAGTTLSPRCRPDLLGGIQVIEGESSSGQSLTFIPYYCWANRGPSRMTVFIHPGSDKPSHRSRNR